MARHDDRVAVLAFDIGGANIKAADGLGWAASEPFPLWMHPNMLASALARLVAARRPRRIVATMTGEIADCFPSREAGVRHIVAAVEAAARAHDPPAAIGIYCTDGTLVPPAVVRADPLPAAAANWHAMARLAAAHAATSHALVIDVGSTTTDIVPVVDAAPAPLACDDVGRMATGELVYTGVERTPVAAIVRTLPWPRMGTGRRPIASERYADARDVWLLLGGVPEDAATSDTADGRPATRAAARTRLARMLLADPEAFSSADAVAAAEWCARAQARTVARAIDRVSRSVGWRPTSIVLSGHGTCLARRALAHLGWPVATISLPDLLGPDASRSACAHAIALIDQGLLP
jgi:probable H4MPT-linked C1 transfer pathway protein